MTMTTDEIEATVKTRLAALPGTSEEIAEYFRANGIKGRPADAYACPVHTYLTKDVEFPVNHKFGAGPYTIGLYKTMFCEVCKAVHDQSPVWEIITPAPVIMFMNSFDDGNWPDLNSRS